MNLFIYFKASDLIWQNQQLCKAYIDPGFDWAELTNILVFDWMFVLDSVILSEMTDVVLNILTALSSHPALSNKQSNS